MLRRLFSVGVSYFVLSFLIVSNTFAGGFYLKSIGAMDVEGTALTQYWYSSTNVNFVGVAPAGTDVNITVDGSPVSTTADANGYWSYATTLAEGDHSVSLANPSSQTYNFTLTIGALPDGVGSLTQSSTPNAGVGAPTIILLVLGIGLLTTPFIYRKFS